ncbi:HAD-like domain-containing protein [Stachybotrys elegans]|uniref:Mitochondrial import inner membrane translocase subunit TIM50 n=1 Tax=Stachybotrys elegans TaxID=80388 RepID=A0A8K0WR22_9HYPO|nr:HAD-like domain-containing protein [Stachybotrys elegans]
MLSRVALRMAAAPAVRLSRPAFSPALRRQPVAASAAVLPWIRTYASKKNKSDSKPESTQPTSSSKDSTPSQPDDAKTPEAKDDEPIPFDKLPDLTQGIPSTFGEEMASQTKKSKSTLKSEETEGEERERRDPFDSYVSTGEQNRQWWVRVFGYGSLGGMLLGLAYLGRGWETEEEKERHSDIPDGWTPMLWWQRMRARFGDSVSYYQEPSFEKLLPDPDPSFSRPYTLCLSLDDLLVHSEWTREHGWRVAKRPGVDYFLKYLTQYYELVLFTSQPFHAAEPLLRKMDPFVLVPWTLGREATKYEDGEIVKDLSYLNRDLSKVIIIDTKAKHVRKQPENAIVLEPWKGDPKDKELVALIPFLEYICAMEYPDVRKILKSFEGKHIPTEFARRESIARREFNAQLAQRKHSKPSGMAALGSMFGMKPSNMSMMASADGEQSASEAFAQGKMLQDIVRERGQKNYEALEQQIRENGEMWLKEQQAAMEKAQQEAMQNMTGSFSTWFTPKPEEKKP